MEFNEFAPQIEEHYKKNLPFAVYKEPESNELHGVLQNSITQHTITGLQRTGFIFVPYSDKNRGIIIPDEHSESISCKVANDFFKTEKSSLSVPKSIEPVAPEYKLMVGKAIELIQRGDLQKVVCSRKEIVNHDSNPIELLFKTMQTYNDAFVYGFFHPRVGFWIGATPETFIKVDGTTFKTMALAGTQKVFPDSKPNWTLKEINEQDFVTQAITESLEQLVKVMVVSKTYNHKAGSLWHICNDIQGTLKNKKEMLQRILDALHPTPAVCGLPRLRAQKFISRYEGYNREYYTGYLGRVTAGLNAKLFVNLRCMKLQDTTAEVFVGGGITEDSIVLDEWIETVNKAETMKQILKSVAPVS